MFAIKLFTTTIDKAKVNGVTKQWVLLCNSQGRLSMIQITKDKYIYL